MRPSPLPALSLILTRWPTDGFERRWSGAVDGPAPRRPGGLRRWAGGTRTASRPRTRRPDPAGRPAAGPVDRRAVPAGRGAGPRRARHRARAPRRRGRAGAGRAGRRRGPGRVRRAPGGRRRPARPAAPAGQVALRAVAPGHGALAARAAGPHRAAARLLPWVPRRRRSRPPSTRRPPSRRHGRRTCSRSARRPGSTSDWRTVSARYQTEPGGATLRIGYLTPEGRGAQLVESNVPAEKLLPAELSGGQPQGTADLPGGQLAALHRPGQRPGVGAARTDENGDRGRRRRGHRAAPARRRPPLTGPSPRRARPDRDCGRPTPGNRREYELARVAPRPDGARAPEPA